MSIIFKFKFAVDNTFISFVRILYNKSLNASNINKQKLFIQLTHSWNFSFCVFPYYQRLFKSIKPLIKRITYNTQTFSLSLFAFSTSLSPQPKQKNRLPTDSTSGPISPPLRLKISSPGGTLEMIGALVSGDMLYPPDGKTSRVNGHVLHENTAPPGRLAVRILPTRSNAEEILAQLRHCQARQVHH